MTAAPRPVQPHPPWIPRFWGPDSFRCPCGAVLEWRYPDPLPWAWYDTHREHLLTRDWGTQVQGL